MQSRLRLVLRVCGYIGPPIERPGRPKVLSPLFFRPVSQSYLSLATRVSAWKDISSGLRGFDRVESLQNTWFSCRGCNGHSPIHGWTPADPGKTGISAKFVRTPLFLLAQTEAGKSFRRLSRPPCPWFCMDRRPFPFACDCF